MIKTLPERTSVLLHIEVKIKDDKGKEHKLFPDELKSLEIKYERHNPVVNGLLLMYDMTDISSRLNIRNASVSIYYMDLFNDVFTRTFKIKGVDELYNESKVKSYKFKLQDEVSYFLSNLYVSKSFNTSKSSALKSIISEYGLDKKLSSDKLKFETEDDEIKAFSITKNMSILEYFLKEFERNGFSFFQNKKGLYIKNKDNLTPNKLEKIPEVFTQATTNQLYKNRVYELINKPAQKEELDKTPKQQSFYYDVEKRQVLSIDNNVSSFTSDMSLNKNTSDIQETTGFKAKFQNRMDQRQQKHDIIERYLTASKTFIIVNGYIVNDINKVIDLELQGHKSSNESVIEGNVISSGKFVILECSDKLIGDKMLQKLTLGRSDSGK